MGWRSPAPPILGLHQHPHIAVRPGLLRRMQSAAQYPGHRIVPCLSSSASMRAASSAVWTARRCVSRMAATACPQRAGRLSLRDYRELFDELACASIFGSSISTGRPFLAARRGSGCVLRLVGRLPWPTQQTYSGSLGRFCSDRDRGPDCAHPSACHAGCFAREAPGKRATGLILL
jgi:hypothetical protein